MWLKVRLAGRALMAFKKFSVMTRSPFERAVKALWDRFERESRKDLYLAEFQTRVKRRTESWREDLRTLVDKAYPSLDDDARQQLALQRYLSQLDNEQVAFGVKQRKPKTIEAAVGAPLELESYLVNSKQGMVAAVRADSTQTLLEMMEKLMARVEKLENSRLPQRPSVMELPYKVDNRQKQRVTESQQQDGEVVVKDKGQRQKSVICFRCGQQGHFARG